MGSSRKRAFLSGYGPDALPVLHVLRVSTCYERRRCFLKAACAMDARQERATKRTSRRFSRSLISANGRGDATILRPRARRPLHYTADLKGRHEMDVHVKGRPSRSSPTRFGKAALLYDQWGAEPREQLMESCTGYGLHEYSMEYGLPRALLCGQWGAEPTSRSYGQ